MKDKLLQIRISGVFSARIDDARREREETRAGFAERILRMYLDGELVERSGGPVRVSVHLPDDVRPGGDVDVVRKMPQSDRVELARKALGQVVRCEHGLELKNCEICSEAK